MRMCAYMIGYTHAHIQMLLHHLYCAHVFICLYAHMLVCLNAYMPTYPHAYVLMLMTSPLPCELVDVVT